jgi:hypothetical protein
MSRSESNEARGCLHPTACRARSHACTGVDAVSFMHAGAATGGEVWIQKWVERTTHGGSTNAIFFLVVDLKMTQKRKHGRPAYVPNAKQRTEVYDLASWGFSLHDIARCLYISVPTLRRHFDEEICTARARKKLEVLDMLWASARAGKVSAMWTLYKMACKASKMNAPRARR